MLNMYDNDFKTIVINRIQDLLNTKDLSDWSENLRAFFEEYRSHPALAPAFNDGVRPHILPFE